jgi:hypothetical protein
VDGSRRFFEEPWKGRSPCCWSSHWEIRFQNPISAQAMEDPKESVEVMSETGALCGQFFPKNADIAIVISSSVQSRSPWKLWVLCPLVVNEQHLRSIYTARARAIFDMNKIESTYQVYVAFLAVIYSTSTTYVYASQMNLNNKQSLKIETSTWQPSQLSGP